MSDPNKYVNYYIENALAMVHEYVNVVLQAKTQARVSSELASEKDSLIESMKAELERSLKDNNELTQAKQNATIWQEQLENMKGKIAHMDTLANQVNEMKHQFISKNDELNKANEEIERLRKEMATKDQKLVDLGQDIKRLEKLVPKSATPKKVLNTKKKSVTVTKIEDSLPVKPVPLKAEPIKITVIEPPEEKTDDF
jgi:DNA repair exonuclease SbcCD ATPase subunit